jgi:hypothetical protein
MKNTLVIDSGLIPFEFHDRSGRLLAAFEMNPADINLAARCDEVAKFFDDKAKNIGKTVADVQKYDNDLTEKLQYLLGCDPDYQIFKPPMSATTILPSGDIFAAVVLERIMDAIAPEIQKRAEKMKAAAEKYTAKYEK